MTKLLAEAKRYGLHIAPRYFKADIRGEKRYQEYIKETFQKRDSEVSKSNYPEDDEDPAGISTHENSLRGDIRKPPEVLQIEDEYNALT